MKSPSGFVAERNDPSAQGKSGRCNSCVIAQRRSRNVIALRIATQLGDHPIWAKGDKPANNAAVSRVQAGLTRLGYNSGPAGGIMGTRTKTAIEAYQRDHGLLVDGRPTVQLAQHIDDQLKLADNN